MVTMRMRRRLSCGANKGVGQARPARPALAGRVAARDLAALGEALAVLQRQIRVAVANSESAALAMIERIGEAHGQLSDLDGRAGRGARLACGHLRANLATVATGLGEVLGQMQFQDVNRQLLEQVDRSLDSLAGHFGQVEALLRGQGDAPPVELAQRVRDWMADYVMDAQRAAHGARQTAPTDAAEAAEPADAQADAAPDGSGETLRIELF